MGKTKRGKGLKKLEQKEKQKQREALLARLSHLKAPQNIQVQLSRTSQIGVVCFVSISFIYCYYHYY